MTWLWALITGNPIARLIGKIAGLVLLVLSFGAYQRRQGGKDQRAEAQRKDSENAQDIRERVATGRPERVQSVQDRGYRD